MRYESQIMIAPHLAPRKDFAKVDEDLARCCVMELSVFGIHARSECALDQVDAVPVWKSVTPVAIQMHSSFSEAELFY